MSDPEDGMPVTVELEGLVLATDQLTRSTSYTYIVNGTGKQTLELKTIAGSTECWVRLSADGYYYDATVKEDATLQLVDKVTINILESATIKLGKNNVNTLRNIFINNGTVTYSNVVFGTVKEGYDTYYTITFNNLVFTGEGINDQTEVTIIASKNSNGTQRTYTTTIGDLRKNTN